MKEFEKLYAQKMNGSMSRRGLLSALGIGTSTLIGARIAGASSIIESAVLQDIGDGDILNFALNLEYLEAEFYAFASMGRGLGMSDTDGMGKAGATTGGMKVPFDRPEMTALCEEIAQDELEHVRFLRSALGKNAVAKPAINLAALGMGFKDDREFLILARAFEDVGVSAYRGAAKLISNKDYLDAAAGILATEAYHAGNIRSHCIYRGIHTDNLDMKDQKVNGLNFFPTDDNGLSIGRTPAEVGMIVRGKEMSGGAFYPDGMNGKIR